MAKFSTAYILLILLTLTLILSASSTVFAEEISKYCYIRMEEANLYPGDRAAISVQFEVGNRGGRRITVPYLMEIYRVDVNRFKGYSDTKELLGKPIRTEEGKVTFESSKQYWQTKEVSKIFTDLSPGYYYTRVRFGTHDATGLFNISRAAIVTKTSDKNLFVIAQDKKTGEPLKDMGITVRTEKTGVQSGYTDENGMLTVDLTKLPKEFTGSMLVVARKGDDEAMCEVNSTDYSTRFKAYIYTDRPVYRPAQKVYIKGILREEKDDVLHPIPNEKVKVQVTDPKGGKVLEKELTTNEYGSITDELMLGEEPPLGNYQIQVMKGTFAQYGSFKVEEYRKPEYEVNVNSKDKYILQGEETKFDVEAKYYFGAPVANSDFTYTITRQNYYPRYYHYWWDEAPPYYYGGYNVKTGKGKTDEKGKAEIPYITEKLTYDTRYTVTVSVIDESRREVSGAAMVTATRGEFYLSLNTDRYFYSPADKVKLNVEAKDYNGKPVATDVDIEVFRSLWNSKTHRYDKNSILKKSIKTDETGKGTLEFTPDRVGYFEISAKAKDSRDNLIMGSAWFYAAENSDSQWIQPGSLNMKSDKKFYEYGDTVKLMVTSPVKGVTALFTLEADGVYETKLVKLEGPVNVIEFKAEQRFAPNVYATISFWKDRNFYEANEKIIIPAKDKFVNVKVHSNKEKYQPRENASFNITTVKEDGTPVSCEVTMGIADESIYAVSPDETPNIQKFFFGIRYNRIRTVSSFLRFYRHAPAGEPMAEAAPPPSPSTTAAPEKKKGMPKNGGADDGLVEPDFVREFFPDTFYFNPHIITDNDGRAKVNAQVPDSLTTWRATAKAASVKTEVGQTTHEFIVTKDLLVRLITPRFMIEGDIAVISGIVHNYTDQPLKAHLSLNAEGVGLMTPKGEGEKIVNVEPNGKANVEWRVKADKSGEAKFTVKALTNKVSDAMMLKIPIHPHGIKIVEAKAGSGDEQVLLSLNLPEDAIRHSSFMEINLSPSLAGTLIGALEYLAGYPYGCVEQTMSRFMPNAVVQASLKEFGLKNEKLEAELPKMMKKGFERLYDYHHSDGGWGWWKNDESHPFMTSYVVYGLTLAKKAGYEIDENKMKSAIAWIEKNYNDKLDLNIRAYMVFAMAEAGVYDNKKLQKLFDDYLKMDDYSRGILAIALYRAGKKSEAETVLHSLEKTVKESERIAFWTGRGARSWTDQPVETTAYIVKAYLIIDPENPMVEKAVRYLTVSRRGNGWYSTKDTAAAVLALLDYVKMTKEMDADFEADLILNGKKIKSASFTKKDIATGGITVKIPAEELAAGENGILVTKKGKGRAYCSATLTCYRKVDRIKAESRGITVKREYFLVTEADKDKTKDESKKKAYRHHETNNPNEKLVPLDPKEIILKPQDVVEVRLTLECSSDNEYVMIEDMKPAGCEAVEKKQTSYWSWWYAQEEFRDEKVVFFATRLWKGSKQLTYRLRAETPGSYRILPTSAELMYFPEVGGNSNEFLMKIKE